jgi:hypothetical protein
MNPFEDFINQLMGDEADGHPVSPEILRGRITAFLNDLPDPLESRLWREYVSGLDRQIAVCLTDEAIVSFIRPSFPQLAGLSDDDLRTLLMIPMTLYLLLTRHLA